MKMCSPALSLDTFPLPPLQKEKLTEIPANKKKKNKKEKLKEKLKKKKKL